MRRRFIADTWTSTTATLSGDQAHHLAQVLRAAPGAVYDIVAGGFLHRAEIVSVAPDAVHFILHEELDAPPSLPVHLLMAIFKFDRLEWGIEKVTELGVARITPILARRTEKHLAQASAKRVDRWRRIALEASKQSRRTDVPEIADPATLASLLPRETSPARILLSETEQSVTVLQALSFFRESAAPGAPVFPCALAIGPEGGWTSEEMLLFERHTWRPATLGLRILRAETAAISALALLGAALTS
jgi:16S rRNA (uracil1498-N3)-methyltransferase